MRETTEWPREAVFTIGHSTLVIEQFVRLLSTYGVRTLVDVRTVPKSRHNPQYNADRLAVAISDHGINYVPMPALGGLRKPSKNSINSGWRNLNFRGYADYMQTPQFEAALEDLITLSQRARTAIMCAEAVPWRCHRSLIADALNAHGLPAVEIFSETNARLHKLTPFARVEGESVTYPAAQQTLL